MKTKTVSFQNFLLTLSLSYLFFPTLIFFLFLFSWKVKALFFLLLISTVIVFFRSKIPFKKIELPWRQWRKKYLSSVMICAAGTLAWLMLSGVGGFGLQNGDWIKHNAILKDLIDRPWPVEYSEEEVHSLFKGETIQRTHLVYYLSYYIPAALCGKLLGWDVANVALFLWTWLGLLLTYLWCLCLLNLNAHPKKMVAFACLFPLLGGMDFVGYVHKMQSIMNWGDHIEWWNGLATMQYSSTASLISWVPQHALPAWLAMLVLLYAWGLESYARLNVIGLVLMSSLGWSPFGFLGILPFACLLLYGSRLLSYVKEHVFYVFMVLFWGLSFYFYYRSGSFSPNLDVGFFSLIWSRNQSALFDYGAFLFIELLPFIVVISMAWFLSSMGEKTFLTSAHKKIILLSLLTLLILPLFRMGIWNDLVMRASIPALLILQIFTFRGLLYFFESRNYSFVPIAFIFLVVSSISSLEELERSVPFWQNFSLQTFAPPRYEDILPTPQAFGEGSDLAKQYVGSKNTFYAKYLGPQ